MAKLLEQLLGDGKSDWLLISLLMGGDLEGGGIRTTNGGEIGK